MVNAGDVDINVIIVIKLVDYSYSCNLICFLFDYLLNKSYLCAVFLGESMNDLVIIQQKIFEIRNQRVMMDRDLAALYGVETRTLNQAVRRNIHRFPPDFMFQLTKEELSDWKSQTVISNSIKWDYASHLWYSRNWVWQCSVVYSIPIPPST